MLQDTFDVRRFDTAMKDQRLTPKGLRTQFRTLRHYLRLRAGLQRALAEQPAAPVLWGAISPGLLGHARDIIATLPCFQANQAIIAIAHRGGFDRIFRSRITARSTRKLVRRVDRFVFTSDYLSTQVASWIPEAQRAIIPYTVEPCASRTNARAKQHGRRPDAPLRLLYLSNMIASKGYLDVLEAIGTVHARGIPVTADFAGRWNADQDRSRFTARVHALGLEAVVTHHGAIRDRARVNALHRVADIFLLPSYYPEEAQPNAIIEALSAATPVIVTRHSGIRDMVREGMEARFVPARSPASIAQAIEVLADISTWQSASMHARSRYDQYFSEKAVCAKWLALLSDFA